VELARNGRRVAVLEAADTIGGGTRSAEITLPVSSTTWAPPSIPLGYASPFFASLPLEEHGLEWVHPQAPLAHPFDDGTAAVLERSIPATAAALGPDAGAYRRLMEPLAADAGRIAGLFVGTLDVPRHPFALAAAGVRSLLGRPRPGRGPL
jgi:phytoene dehydrogenase-like protein